MLPPTRPPTTDSVSTISSTVPWSGHPEDPPDQSVVVEHRLVRSDPGFAPASMVTVLEKDWAGP